MITIRVNMIAKTAVSVKAKKARGSCGGPLPSSMRGSTFSQASGPKLPNCVLLHTAGPSQQHAWELQAPNSRIVYSPAWLYTSSPLLCCGRFRAQPSTPTCLLMIMLASATLQDCVLSMRPSSCSRYEPETVECSKAHQVKR